MAEFAEQKKEKKLSILTQQLTSTFSVSLVLLILGIVISIVTAARAEISSIKENLGFNIVLIEEPTQADLDLVSKTLDQLPYVVSYTYISPDSILSAEQEDIGEDIVELLGVNPYPGEFDVKVSEKYANNDSINAIAKRLVTFPMIETIDSRADTIENVNRSLSTISLILTTIAAALLVVSLVLINNTVWLTIYSRRFLIHTMQLVGATAWFIRRPIMIRNMVNGLIAGAVASIVLAGLRIYGASFEPEVDYILSWPVMFIIFGVMTLTGVLICVIGAYIATQRYLSRSYDELF